ncbi:ubiquinol oxidase subunit II [Buchnera aphidicola]|uniref:ubiquinol oxidase subunit II n=1 Tax=Buchnera aphidicola TaxID=9 RepID=UPI00094C0958|nr:ubiquinol oxidase subunit II [Buchnera aphidicola]
MKFLKCRTCILNFFLTSFIFTLYGCSNGVLNPKGYIAVEQRSLILTAFLSMLCIIIPVFFMTLFFLIKFRENNSNANYKPNWSNSHMIELLVWGFPILIICFLSILSWKSSHDLDPKKLIISNVRPIKIYVVSLDWKWLFIYPNENVATINELVFPVNTPIIFELTSNSVMNSFFIPSLGSQIYTMAGMKTKLNLIANESGIYKGISSNYSGVGFSNMKFRVIITKNYFFFKKWIQKVKNSSDRLDFLLGFRKIAYPSENETIKYYKNVEKNLFNIIVKKSQDIKK